MRDDRIEAKREADSLDEPAREARELAERLGLAPYPVRYWVVDHDQMNELIAYGGFQRRYPHWRWGMNYERQSKLDRHGLGKAFEIVNNDDPAHAFLQESNSAADQKAVITHVEAHADFFANNEWFGLYADRGEDGPNAAARLERNADRIAAIAARTDVDRDEVERLIDAVSALEDAIDQHSPVDAARSVEEPGVAADVSDGDDEPLAAIEARIDDLDLSEEVRRDVFDDEWLEARGEGVEPEEPRPDVLAFLRDHGKRYDPESGKAVDREPWETTVIDAVREEAYYFAGQKQTKVMNEGWACVAPDTPVFTEEGLLPMCEVVEDLPTVSDGNGARATYDSNVIADHDTVSIETRRGFELRGSESHRVRKPDGSWVEMRDISKGNEIEISGGGGLWSTSYVDIDWQHPEHTTLDDVADEAGVSIWTVMRYRKTGRAERSEAIERALTSYDGENQIVAKSEIIAVPDRVSEELGRLLGLLVGDGHVSKASGQVGFTSGSKAKAEEFAGLADELFGVSPTVSEDGSRWRAYIYSMNLVRLLTEWFDLRTGAADKIVPKPVLRSPKPVVSEFLRGLFDADGYAGDQGVILSTKSKSVSKVVQLLLANFDILSRRREQSDGCFHVHLTGKSADRFHEEIGFGYSSKDKALKKYLDELAWFEIEEWTDEVVSVEEGTGDVYDISVEETHRYAGAGFINHNSYWESTMMGGEGFAGPDEFLTYADHMSRVLGSPGLNPYKLGFELWTHVELRAARREVLDKLLRVEGVTPENFHSRVDLDEVADLLEPHPAIAGAGPATLDELAELAADGDPRVDAEAVDRALSARDERGAGADAGESEADDGIDVERYPWKLLTREGLAERHYVLSRPEHRGALRNVSRAALEEQARYLFDVDRYETVAAAVADVDRAAGWDRMVEVRESHNDVTFIDAFLTDEFVREGNYFTYEYSRAAEEHRVASVDADDVRRKLLLRFTNFGKPTVVVLDGNFRNRGELLLGHRYNGVALDEERARATLKRVFELWGRPVNLATIRVEYDDGEVRRAKRRGEEPEGTEVGVRLQYDGGEVTEHDLDDAIEARIAADEVDYDTKPDDWLA
ncbi:SpoVR family protein [Halorubrum sp. GN11_10-6_MGM]|uniref:SpoVR family protein n=1 Tax=Halorubrum sp. GN11_10-6_MGM TaxID=2518112 RepID=UPI0010F78920|nr:SpoVR family protein [Halorubrum sp. GN11_10-6_MGM]TKX74612.1 SpoVR family protein [Halorubrum sp. GN11_10-6_MGM]